jgi:hypothetical protein
MSTDPREKRPGPEDKRRTIPTERAEPTAQLGATRRQMPQGPVVPRFSELPQTPTPSHRVEGRGCNGYTTAVLAMSVIVLTLVVLALFLPPFWGCTTSAAGL